MTGIVREVTIGPARLILGDCVEVLPLLGKVDAVVTDPPYSAKTHSGHDARSSNHGGSGYDGSNRKSLGYAPWTEHDVEKVIPALCGAASGWVVVMTDHILARPIQQAMEKSSRYAFAPLPWYVPGSRVRLSGDGPSSWVTWIVVSRTKIQSRWGTLPGGYMDRGEQFHMGGKPVELMESLVADYSRHTETILDPFMGSGTTGVACIRTERQFIGIEREPKYFDIAVRRISQAWQLKCSELPFDEPPKLRQREFLGVSE